MGEERPDPVVQRHHLRVVGWRAPGRARDGVAGHEEYVGTGAGCTDPRAGQSDGTGVGTGRQVPADGVTEHIGDGTGGKGYGTVLSDRHEVGEGDSDGRLPAPVPRPVRVDGWDPVFGACQIVPVGRRRGRQHRRAA